MPETQNIEYKSSWHDDYLKWVCGFANAQGGKIYIGMNDAATVVGVEDQKILDDLCELSGGKIKLSAEDFHLTEQRTFTPRRRQVNNNQQKRKY